MKEFKGDLHQWEDILVCGLENDIVEMEILPKLMYRFSAIPI